MITERWELAKERIKKIPDEHRLPKERDDFFTAMAHFISQMGELYTNVQDGMENALDFAGLKAQNYTFYQDIIGDCYHVSYANPEYACSVFGTEEGQLLSFLYVEMRNLITYAFEQELYEMVIRAELLLEVYGAYLVAYEEDGKCPSAALVKQILYWFVSDYYEEEEERRIRRLLDPTLDFAARIITESDLNDLRYLYRFGEYISEDEIKVATFLNSLPEETIRVMADTYTEGYRTGFLNAGKDLSRKNTVNIRYSLGFERMVKYAMDNFEKMGLKPVIYRAEGSIFTKRGANRIGYTGACANKQYEYDHKDDIALFLDGHLITRKTECLKAAFEKYKELAGKHAGPACIETFGEAPFSPENQPSAVHMTKEQSQMMSSFRVASARLQNDYIPMEERSFTIIAFPTPAVGEPFEAIFADIIRINTLDMGMYRRIHQSLIDTLDQADYVVLKGKGENRTDIKVELCKLENPEKQTKFENCLADVNIPVGEVFTSPVLEGTNGILHVSRVFLNELEFKNLTIELKDGMVTDYSCTNFDDAATGRKYIEDNVLYHHQTLPVGEFAIGTNTTAYAVAVKYDIFNKLPILIAEKMGPHFALGDTCYSEEEDIPVYNPDGKEAIARENSVSAARKSNPNKAYFGCHTDITIPYDEIESLSAVSLDGKKAEIIKDGRFVLQGTEELNRVFV